MYGDIVDFMTNILYLITDLNYGGTEKVLSQIINGLDKTRYAARVCSLKSDGYYARKIARDGVPVRTFDVYRYGKLGAVIRMVHVVSRLAVFVKGNKIDVIHSFLFQANMVAKIVGLVTGCRVITSVRVMEQQKKWQLTVEKLTKSLSERILVNSVALKSFVLYNMKVPDSKVKVVYNGVDTGRTPDPAGRKSKRAEFGLAEQDVLVGTVGRLHKQKGVEFFISAAKDVLSVNPKIKFMVVGDGPEKVFLADKSRQLGIEKNVIFTGQRDDAAELISVMDIFVLASLWEGTPNVILESMGYGIPVISTNVGGVAELIQDNVTGLLVEPGNAKALAVKIMLLLTNRGVASKISTAAKQTVIDKFSVARMVKETVLLYENNSGVAGV
jgi:glycosyltransferase involved in cell wall biosynthesis